MWQWQQQQETRSLGEKVDLRMGGAGRKVWPHRIGSVLREPAEAVLAFVSVKMASFPSISIWDTFTNLSDFVLRLSGSQCPYL